MTTAPKLTFEQALAELEKLTLELEHGDVPLEELIAKFEKGSALAAQCREKLAALEQKIEVLTARSAAAETAVDAEKTESPMPDVAAPRKTARKALEQSDDLF